MASSVTGVGEVQGGRLVEGGGRTPTTDVDARCQNGSRQCGEGWKESGEGVSRGCQVGTACRAGARTGKDESTRGKIEVVKVVASGGQTQQPESSQRSVTKVARGVEGLGREKSEGRGARGSTLALRGDAPKLQQAAEVRAAGG